MNPIKTSLFFVYLLPRYLIAIMQNYRRGIILFIPVCYLRCFAKAGCLSDFVLIHMHEDVPLLIEYCIKGFGSLKYYLAPKQDDENDDDEEAGSDGETGVKLEVTSQEF